MSTNRDSQRSLRSRRYWSPLRSRVSTAIVKSVYENLAADLLAYKHAVDQDDQPATVQETRRAKINDALGAAMLMFHTADHKHRVKPCAPRCRGSSASARRSCRLTCAALKTG